jgi:anti-anti-sigma factor
MEHSLRVPDDLQLWHHHVKCATRDTRRRAEIIHAEAVETVASVKLARERVVTRRRRAIQTRPPDPPPSATPGAGLRGRVAPVADDQSQLRIAAHRIDAGTVIAPLGHIDLATREQLDECLECCAGVVHIDLAGVSFLDASGIGVLVRQHKRLEESGGSLVLRRPTPWVCEVLTLIGLDHWIDD